MHEQESGDSNKHSKMNVTRFILENMAARVIGTKIPPYFLFNDSRVRIVDSDDYHSLNSKTDEELADIVRTNALGVPMYMPLELRVPGGEWWLLPVEPLISVTGRNTITKRHVSKGRIRGSIKERWTQDDYSVKISGVLMNYEEKAYPKADVTRLKNICENAIAEVRSPLFEIFSINRIVIESYNMPFTSGIENQAYDIEACSDDIYKLLLRRDE